MTLQIDMIAGFCPVQAEGTICGKPFYFRARGQHWSMGIGGDPVMAAEWYAECSWGEGKFAAGWMPEDEARRLIEWCASEYIQNAAREAPAPVLPSDATTTPETENAAQRPQIDGSDT